MTCTDAAGVELARSLGATRVILARELSLEDIAAIRAGSDAELEVFVHGALCISYSGQCLTSEAIGGRSANRGACAQACRLPYELVVDGALRDLGDRAYLLSPEDLEASALVPELARLGVSSLKIEGRLKGPEYVAATTALYRAAIDAQREARRTRLAALQTFTRGSGPGFLGGVDHQRLVEGRACDHRGLQVGTCEGVERARGPRGARRARRGGHRARRRPARRGRVGGEGEVGGRVWDLEHGGGRRDARVARAGPERRARAGRAGASSRRAIPRTRRPSRRTPSASRSAWASTCACGARSASPSRCRRRARAAHAARGDRRRAGAGRADEPRRRARSSRRSSRASATRRSRSASLEVDLPEGAMLPCPRSTARAARSSTRLVASHRAAHATTTATHAATSSPPRSRRTARRRPRASSSSAAPWRRPTRRSTRAPTASTSTSSSSPAPAPPCGASARAASRRT